MNFVAFKDWALLGLLTVGLYILGQMNHSLGELNIKIAVIISDQEASKADILDHEARIRTIERNK